MQVTGKSLEALLLSLPARSDELTLGSLVERTLSETKSQVSQENLKNQWEFALRRAIFNLAGTEGQALKDPSTTYYAQLSALLDVVLAFTEKDACDPTFPFTILQDLLETQTIVSCSHIFSWIEAHAERLTAGMVPQKGKALVLLRMLNDLLRRLSNTGATTMFCGRILAFLSRVFPLGERSGVNLRGEYGPAWTGPESTSKEKKDEHVGTSTEKDKDKMDVDEAQEENAAVTAAEKRRKEKEDFYFTFWSLQQPFSRPALFSDPKTFPAFKEAVAKVLPVIKDANAKERALMGSKSNHASAGTSGPLKRKRDTAPGQTPSSSQYYFAKYLTSPELLDLEIADTHFRRQFLFQLLILLHHLLTFTKTAKAAWATPRNRSLQIEFTLDDEGATWAQETIARATEELRATAPAGRAFADTVHAILEREKNWIKWKNELCTPFDREAWSAEVEVEGEGEDGMGEKRRVGLEEATAGVRKKMKMEPEAWPHRYGSAPLTEIWEMGYRDLYDLQHPFRPGEIKDFVKKIKLEDQRINMRRSMLQRQAERIAAARAKAAAAAAPKETPPPPTPTPAVEPTSGAAADGSSEGAKPSTSLHPSLPAKPGTSPAPPDSPHVMTSPARGSTPNPPGSTSAVADPPPVAAPEAKPDPKPEPVPPPVVIPSDPQIEKFEENKLRTTWLALRTARETHLQLLGKIGMGDVVALEQEIEKEQAAAAEAAAAAAAAAALQASSSQQQPRSSPPPGMDVPSSDDPVGLGGEKSVEGAGPGEAQSREVKADAEGDVKMEAS